MEKARILDEIRRTATENGGKPLGQGRFEQETGIPQHKWRGKYWRNWGDALREAGLVANSPPKAHEVSDLVEQLAKLARRLGRLPTHADVQLARAEDSAFPSSMAFRKHIATQGARIESLRRLARDRQEYADVLALLPENDAVPPEADASFEARDGAVYMLKLGKHYKIGKTFSVPRRHREIALELPEKPDVVHVITTDDPSGIESYWHSRFAAKRTNGEWFALSRDDVAAFKRRKFM